MGVGSEMGVWPGPPRFLKCDGGYLSLFVLLPAVCDGNGAVKNPTSLLLYVRCRYTRCNISLFFSACLESRTKLRYRWQR